MVSSMYLPEFQTGVIRDMRGHAQAFPAVAALRLPCAVGFKGLVASPGGSRADALAAWSGSALPG